MTSYRYRGFNLVYEITVNGKKLYEANGKVLKVEHDLSIINFQTTYPTKAGAKQEIKKLLENYVNVEWEEYQAMH